MEVKAVRGMRDLFGNELQKWLVVENKVREVFRAFGYHEIRTPVLEKVEVFSQTVGDDTDIVEKQMYQIAQNNADAGDKGETLVLRPEGTAAFVRAILEHQLHREPGPGRYFYNLPMFRHERPQKGRLRQFFQFGAELINDASPEADAELITLLHTIYGKLGVSEYEIEINSVGDANCRPKYKEALQAYFRPRFNELCPQCQKRFERAPMRILDCKSEACKAIANGAPTILEHLCEPCAAHQTALKKRLNQAGVPFTENPKIVRGLDYYSRTAFEFTSNLLGAQSALGGGGRYDGLAARFGEQPFPAVGWGMGMERLMMVLEQKGTLSDVRATPSIFLIALGEAAFEKLYPLSLALRQKGLAVDMSYERDKKMKWLMKQADRSGAPFALLLGDDELAKGEAVLKNMKESTQETLQLGALETELQRRLQK